MVKRRKVHYTEDSTDLGCPEANSRLNNMKSAGESRRSGMTFGPTACLLGEMEATVKEVTMKGSFGNSEEALREDEEREFKSLLKDMNKQREVKFSKSIIPRGEYGQSDRTEVHQPMDQ